MSRSKLKFHYDLVAVNSLVAAHSFAKALIFFSSDFAY